MAISMGVRKQLFVDARAATNVGGSSMGQAFPATPKIIRLPASTSSSNCAPSRREQTSTSSCSEHTVSKRVLWTESEHERFLEAMELFPSGPWRAIASYVGTKTERQAISHAQKYRQRIERHKRGLRKRQRVAHRGALTAIPPDQMFWQAHPTPVSHTSMITPPDTTHTHQPTSWTPQPLAYANDAWSHRCVNRWDGSHRAMHPSARDMRQPQFVTSSSSRRGSFDADWIGSPDVLIDASEATCAESAGADLDLNDERQLHELFTLVSTGCAPALP